MSCCGQLDPDVDTATVVGLHLQHIAAAVQVLQAPSRRSVQRMSGVSAPHTYQRGMVNDSASPQDARPCARKTIWLAKNTESAVQNNSAHTTSFTRRATR